VRTVMPKLQKPQKKKKYSAPCAVKKSKQKQISPFQTKKNWEIFKLWSLTTIYGR
jgi:hypothetical protein